MGPCRARTSGERRLVPADSGPGKPDTETDSPATAEDGVPEVPIIDDEHRSLGAIVSVGEKTTTVSVHDGGGLLFARVLMTGVGAAASLSHELESQLAEVENLRAGGHASTDDYVPNNDAPGVGVVAEGIRRTLHFHTTDIDKRPIDRVMRSSQPCQRVARPGRGCASSGGSHGARTCRLARCRRAGTFRHGIRRRTLGHDLP